MIKNQAMFAWLKSTITKFVLPFATPEQKSMIHSHVNRMEQSGRSFALKCEAAQGADGLSMRLVISIVPADMIGRKLT